MSNDLAEQQLARIAQAMANPKRLRLLHLLCQGEKSIEELAAQGEQSLALVSAHIKLLRDAHLIYSRKVGRRVYCQIADESIVYFLVSLRKLGEGCLPELRELRREQAPLSGGAWVSGPELLQILDAGNIFLLDVRPEEEYACGYILWAKSLPYPALKDALDWVSRAAHGREIVVYGRGPYCALASRAVALLRDFGLPATNLLAGVAEWYAADMPLGVT